MNSGRRRKSLLVLSGVFFASLISCTYNTTNPPDKKEATSNQTAATSLPIKEPAGKNVDTLATEKPVMNAWLLVPGESAGLTHLNEDAEKVYHRFGPPDGGDAAMQKAVAIWYTNHDSTQHSTAIYTAREPGIDPAARVKQIRITSPSFQTAEGIHTGSTLKEIEAAYPIQKMEMYTDAGTTYRVFDSQKGIAFEVQPDGGCVAIVIHKAGVVNEGSYLKFRTTNKFIAGRKAG